MHSAHFAEWILSLVTTPERASSTVGDLLEDVQARGWNWFWLCVMRTAGSSLWQIFAKAPVSLVGQAILGWFYYLFSSLLLWFAAVIAAPVAWGLFYFFAHHTGLELLTNLLKIRIDWPDLPEGVMYWIEAAVVLMLSPFWVGRSMARSLPGREIVTWLLMALLWPAMAIYIPFTSRHIRATLGTLPFILAAMLAGILWERAALARPSDGPAPGTP